MRLEIYVRPNASKTSVGGSYDGAVVVRVREIAEKGRATSAALQALADALALPVDSVSLVRRTTSRRKLVDITAGSDPEILQRIEALRAES